MRQYSTYVIPDCAWWSICVFHFFAGDMLCSLFCYGSRILMHISGYKLRFMGRLRLSEGWRRGPTPPTRLEWCRKRGEVFLCRVSWYVSFDPPRVCSACESAEFTVSIQHSCVEFQCHVRIPQVPEFHDISESPGGCVCTPSSNLGVPTVLRWFWSLRSCIIISFQFLGLSIIYCRTRCNSSSSRIIWS